MNYSLLTLCVEMILPVQRQEDKPDLLLLMLCVNEERRGTGEGYIRLGFHNTSANAACSAALDETGSIRASVKYVHVSLTQ